MSKFIIYALSAVAEIYIANIFFSWISKSNFDKIFFKISFLGLVMLQTCNAIFLGNTSLMMLVTIVILFATSLLYRMRWYLRIIGSILLCIFMAMAEMFVVLITTLGGKINVATIQENVYLFAICTLLAKFLTFVLVNAMAKRKHYMNTGFTYGFIASSLILPISSILIISLLYYCCYEINSKIFRVLTLISSMLLIITNVIVLFIIDRQGDYIATKQNLAFAEKSIKQQKDHYKELYKAQEEIRFFKHDMKNYFISLKSLVSSNNIESAENSINQKISLFDYKSRGIIDTKNPILDSIITSKKNYAEELGIQFKASIKLSNVIHIDILDLGVLLGNGIDNAIEAQEKIPINKRNIYLQLISVGETITIVIKNPVDHNVQTLSTSKRDKNNHGIGLKSIRSIVEKYLGNLETSCVNNIFCLNIIIQNRAH